MQFTGTVSSRSSSKSGGPPGETEIQQLNPQRAERLHGVMGWDRLDPGSLNVEVDESVAHALLDDREPDVFETAESIRYPDAYQSIPGTRGGYRYFRCEVESASGQAGALVRRAVNPLEGRVELFAPVKLREVLAVKDGDSVTIQLLDAEAAP